MDERFTQRWQRVEGAVLFAVALGVMLSGDYGLPVWAAIVVFFAPDLSFLGYVLGPRMGAWIYNSVHNYGLGAGVFALGAMLSAPLGCAIGLLLLAHTGFDRMLGYGLKSRLAFGVTHLGRIGRDKLSVQADQSTDAHRLG
ncbi:DUF4260 domain-containing protein [Devosia sp. MC532]|uniref:DUF4260 domain-containing protein n=1 Tax=Devosia sp. MC532 TaxID=2799788 RepID=UPI0018F718C4|nr:DUF4260 domain-containing protein [Devosia sp. MC532]MBJ7578680.1 DUF4260 domain-containing protein [Devosia sp. MC532]